MNWNHLFGVFDDKGKRVRVGDLVRWIDSDGGIRFSVAKWNWKHGFTYLCNKGYSIECYRPFRKVRGAEASAEMQKIGKTWQEVKR